MIQTECPRRPSAQETGKRPKSAFTSYKKALLASFLLFSQFAFANPFIDCGLPYYPDSSAPQKKESTLLEGAFDLTYESSAKPEAVYGYYLKSIPDSKWTLKALQDTSLDYDHLKTTQITLSLLSKDQSSAAQLVIFREGTASTNVMVTYVPDLASITHAQRPPPPVETGTDDEDEVEHSEFFPLLKPLADIKRLANKGKYQELHQLGSSYFKQRVTVQQIQKQLEPQRIKELDSLYSESTAGLKTAIIKFELKKSTGTEHGHRNMYFNFEDGQWKYNNLPFLDLPLLLPEAHRMKFE